VKFRALVTLAWREVSGNAFRSWVIGLCAFVIAVFVLSTALIVRGSGDSLALTLKRLGADILVVPQGAETQVQGALLTGSPTKYSMPTTDVDLIRGIDGVEAASQQLYLESLANASCCAVSNMFMVAYEPSTDFTVGPWLKTSLGSGGLALGDAIGGVDVSATSAGHGIKLYGYLLHLRANLERTGTNLDNSIFMTFQTAGEMAELSKTQAQQPLTIPPDAVSSVLVKVTPGAHVDDVAAGILRAVPGVTAIESPDMFSTFRSQISVVREGMVAVLAMAVVFSLVLTGFLFSMSVNERRRQIGVMRALGATRRTILLWLFIEAEGVALVGGIVGGVLAAACIYLFRSLLSRSLGFFVFPSPALAVGLIVAGLVAAVVCIAAAVAIPAVRICRGEPAMTMRE
jgi:putative ABC transport system permease protein